MAAKVTIIGMGLIGTSFGMALRQSRVAGNLKITGHDREPTASREAQKRGAVENVEWSLPRAIHDADYVIIATPVMTIREVMEQIAEHLKEDAVVTDTGSTKKDILRWADEILPRSVSFIGGHPMAGSEASGPRAAEVKLFDNAVYCLMPGSRATPQAVQEIVQLVEATGAKPFFMDPVEHDSFIAAVSHLPLLVSSALTASVTKSPSWHEMSRLAAGGFRDLTRLASGDPEMNRDICVTNAKEIASWVDRMIAELLELRKHLQEDDEEALTRHFLYAYEQREQWMSGVPLTPTGKPNVDIPSTGERISALVMGDLLASKSRAVLKRYEDYDKKHDK